MSEKRYFIIDVEETHQENAVWQYDDKLDDYDFVCFEDDSDNLVMKLNELAKVNKELKEENEELKKEINMLKTTIRRNETYIQRMKYGGEWK